MDLAFCKLHGEEGMLWVVSLIVLLLLLGFTIIITDLKGRFHVYIGQPLSPHGSLPSCTIMCHLFVTFIAF